MKRKSYRSIYEWCTGIDREIAYLRESQEKAYSTLRNTTQKHHAILLGKDDARYYSDELDTLLNRTSSYYYHLIADLYRQKEHALLKHENRNLKTREPYNLYAELIKEFKGLKQFACNDLRDFIITIVPGWMSVIDVVVNEENLQRHVHRIERRGIGMTVVRKDGKLCVYKKLNWV